MIGTTIGNYRIERELSEGGMSHVYVARTVRASEVLPEGFPVVVKVMSEELAGEAVARKRFVKEGQILSKLRHRYITRFYEFIPRDKGAVLVMEFVQGTPVDALIRQSGPMKISEAVLITQCLLEALVYAHGKGIVHRDIKPANLICDKPGSAKVTDFGIAKITETAGTGQTVLTKSGFLLGTPHYMSPEQIREPKDAGARCDIYSTAVVLYEMLTGTVPFNSRSLPKLIDCIYRGEKESPRKLRGDIDTELEEILLRAMRPLAAERYETARQFYEALEEFQSRAIFPSQRPSGSDVPTGVISEDVVAAGRSQPASRPPVPAPVPAKKSWQLVSVRKDLNEMHDINGGTVMVGRDRTCSIVLPHPAVSRRHARITTSETGFLLEDLQSANGTFVNDARVEKSALKPGDVVRFGADPACSYVLRERASGGKGLA